MNPSTTDHGAASTSGAPQPRRTATAPSDRPPSAKPDGAEAPSIQTRRRPKIMLGGVPFGRDNVGDEAILACVVAIVRELRPDADISVSTDDPHATRALLGVRTHPLFGFQPPGYRIEDMHAALAESDAFIWAGATGLSDYPEIPLQMIQCARAYGSKAVVFCTGMNRELNPALYRLRAGKRKLLYDQMRTLSRGRVDLVRRFENKKKHATRQRMRRAIQEADLVVLRDEQSRDTLVDFIGPNRRAGSRPWLVGADPAITLKAQKLSENAQSGASFAADIIAAHKRPSKKIGLCISAQRPVRQLDGLARILGDIAASGDIEIVGIPMNPISDTALLQRFRSHLARPEAMCVAQGRHTPEAITALAAEMDVVISSRLHLLMLASIHLVPIVGMSRGSKVTNFTGQFGLPDVGAVEALNLDALDCEVRRLLAEGDTFRERARTVRTAMLERLDGAKRALGDLLASL